MEPVVSAMSTFLTNIGTVLTSSVTWFGDISSALIGNEVFTVIVALVIMLVLATFLVNLIGKIRTRAK